MLIPKALTRLSVAFCLLRVATSQTVLKIMPLGDSITDITCWRAMLWQQLQNAGVKNIDFVGSMVSAATCDGISNYDRNHEGHSGYLAVDIANKNQLVGWLNSAKPDIVMFHLGTNDIGRSKTPAETIAAFTTLLDQMRASKSSIKVIVAQIIPLPWVDSGIRSLNSAIASWATLKNTTSSPIYVVDQYTGFTTSDLQSDQIHPNESGDKKITARWYPTLLKVIQNSQAGKREAVFSA
ncbi:Uncharacterized protein BP5553_07438 [Venustampulla echinocandica]|uniref:SGNH hydrolase-type esterase domain-containing protein n=1 Tax=Venustampulla echinocandica TaxID=2656787 RepID=A0A370TGJ1_9HELO|nr:Uncharacterized protein BP5553_07438 [Venustampulla echinocandica]RDL34310.1 Uncharacterized protein BP5553_07438 [Venustampulla echinocandica]